MYEVHQVIKAAYCSYTNSNKKILARQLQPNLCDFGLSITQVTPTPTPTPKKVYIPPTG
jgi:hypothetical protein